MPKTLYPRWMYTDDYNPKDPNNPATSELVRTPERFEQLTREGWLSAPPQAKGQKNVQHEADDAPWAGDRAVAAQRSHVVVEFPKMLYAADYDGRTNPGAVFVVKAGDQAQEQLDALLAEGWLLAPPSAAAVQRQQKPGMSTPASSSAPKPQTVPAGPNKPSVPKLPDDVNEPFDPTEFKAAEVVDRIESMSSPSAIEAVMAAEQSAEKPRRSVISAAQAKVKTLTAPPPAPDTADAADNPTT